MLIWTFSCSLQRLMPSEMSLRKRTHPECPAIVSDKGGPKYIVRPDETGFIAKGLEDFIKYSFELYDDREKLAKMRTLSREHAMSRSWDSIFEGVYDGYREASWKD